MTCLPEVAQPPGLIDNFFYIYRRTKRFSRRRLNYLKNNLIWPGEKGIPSHAEPEISRTVLLPGDWVKIRASDEIQATLDGWNSLKGCTFLEEMKRYCGTTSQVYKRVEQFLDERDYRLKKCRGMVILDGVICEGTIDFGKCDRSCFFFWREEWLQKLDHE